MIHSLRRMALAGFAGLALLRGAYAQTPQSCEQAGRAAEQSYGVPPGLLLAIGRVESGRWDARSGRTIAWPWSIDVDGQGRQFASDSAAIDATRRAQAAQPYNIDVGCFQISLRHHPQAFANLAEAFDPRANARYAAQFLASLHARLGTWQDAIAAYHSMSPERGLPYRQRVLAAWHGNADAAPTLTAQFTTIYGIHIWVPTPAFATSQTIAVNSVVPTHALPRIITPSR